MLGAQKTKAACSGFPFGASFGLLAVRVNESLRYTKENGHRSARFLFLSSGANPLN